MSLDLSIIIVNWNVGLLLRDCLRSIYAMTRGISFEIIVVDNASKPGDLDQVKCEYPEVRYVQMEANVGFAKANNVGFELIAGRYVAALNPDTYLINNAFQLMAEYLDRNPQVGAVGPKILGADGRIQPVTARSFPTLLTEFSGQLFLDRLFPRSPIWGRPFLSWWDRQDTRPVEVLSGACMVVRSEVIRQVGGFDERFFLYGDDVDWSQRIRKAGHEVVYMHEPAIVHLGGASSSQDFLRCNEAAAQALILLFRKHYGPVRTLALRVITLFGALNRIVLWLCLSLTGKYRAEGRRRSRGYLRVAKVALLGPSAFRA